MKQLQNVDKYFKLCLGFSATIVSIGFLIFSIKFDAVKAGSLGKNHKDETQAENYVPVGVIYKGATVYLYGYSKNALFYERLKQLASCSLP